MKISIGVKLRLHSVDEPFQLLHLRQTLEAALSNKGEQFQHCPESRIMTRLLTVTGGLLYLLPLFLRETWETDAIRSNDRHHDDPFFLGDLRHDTRRCRFH